MEGAASRLLGGRYRLGALVGEGAISTVSCAQDELLQRTVAVKLLKPAYAQDEAFVARFYAEARMAAKVVHPNVVAIYDISTDRTSHAIVMEYVDGTTGARLIRAAAGQAEELPLDACLHIVLSILHALEYAHSARDDDGKPLSLVHRDVSPGNVLIDRTGAVKLTDFGIARAAEIERRTDAGQLKGKLGYMSPEQVVGREPDARSDIFTLGIVFGAFHPCLDALPFLDHAAKEVFALRVDRHVAAQRHCSQRCLLAVWNKADRPHDTRCTARKQLRRYRIRQRVPQRPDRIGCLERIDADLPVRAVVLRPHRQHIAIGLKLHKRRE